ncbi:MAG: CPBP family intramembrane metalloprotease [Clostridium sp.]|nr:CPBP family intramembrane metalloprotease [Clostridium sp.]
MNSKRVNWLFLCLILANIMISAMSFVYYILTGKYIDIPIAVSLMISQGIIMIPSLIFIRESRTRTVTGDLNELLGYRTIKVSSFFMILLFTFLIMPMANALNAISMLFVENTVNEMSGEVVQMPFVVMLFLIGMFGPFCEEFVFRGVIFRGYKTSGSVFRAVCWSALLFGLMHLNFNQAAYAIALGIMLALLVEATGSLWSSTIAHMFFNAQQVCLMYLSNYLPESAASDTLTQEMLISAIGLYLIIAAVATPIAVCVLAWLAKNENREIEWRNIWIRQREKGTLIVSIPLVIAIVISLALMSLEWILKWILELIAGM